MSLISRGSLEMETSSSKECIVIAEGAVLELKSSYSGDIESKLSYRPYLIDIFVTSRFLIFQSAFGKKARGYFLLGRRFIFKLLDNV